MSGVLAYCITSLDGAGAGAARDFAGVAGRPIVVREVEGLALWMSSAARSPGADVAAIHSHRHVVDRAWRATDACLPLRYGQWFPSPEDAVAAVVDRLGPLRDGLERVRETVEYEVRVELRRSESTAPGPAEGGASEGGTRSGPGTAYLESLRLRHVRMEERDRRRREVLATLERSVEDLVRDRRESGGEGSTSVAHLLARSAESGYVQRLRAVVRSAADLHIELKGPWPPWSFGA